MKLIPAIIACLSVALAQDAKAPETKPIPAVLYGEFYRARGQVIEAKHSMDAAVAAIVEYCGPNYAPSIDIFDSGKNVCKLKANADQRAPAGTGTSGSKPPGI